MIFVRTVNGIVNAHYIVRAYMHRSYEGYAQIEYLDSDMTDASNNPRALCKVEELAVIGISADDLAYRPIDD